MNSDREPCLSIDIGKMIKKLTKDRTQGPLSLMSRGPRLKFRRGTSFNRTFSSVMP